MLDECAAHPLALELGEYSQRRQDGSRNLAERSSENRFGEQDMPDWLVLQEGEQRKAGLSRGILEQVRYQRRLIFARKGHAFYAQYGV